MGCGASKPARPAAEMDAIEKAAAQKLGGKTTYIAYGEELRKAGERDDGNCGAP